MKADKVRSRNQRKNSQKSSNPFEQQHNKSKFSVLGRKEKNNKGTPGASRNKAEKQRKATIGVDLKNINKSNKFYDRRITSKTDDLTSLKKFIVHKKAVTKHKSKFHLDSSEDENDAESDDEGFLTHKGQNLSDIKNHYVPSTQDDILDEIDASTQRRMAESNFGGGALGLNVKQTREDAMNEMIRQNYLKKFQRQDQNEENMEKTAELDEKFMALMKEMRKDDKKHFLNKDEKKDLYSKEDPGFDDWYQEADNMKYEKRVQPDKDVKLNKSAMEEVKKERAIKEAEDRELIFEKPEDEREKKKEKEIIGENVDAIYNPVEIRNTAEPIAFDEDGRIQEKYRQLRNTGDVGESSESEAEMDDDLENEIGDNSDENYSEDSLFPPEKLPTWLKLKITSEKLSTWLRSCNQIPDGTRNKKLKNLLLNSINFVLFSCHLENSLGPLKTHFQVLTEIISHNNSKFVQLICQKWDVLSDKVCPSIDAELSSIDRCYSKISNELSDEKLQGEDLGISDYAMITLTANCFYFNRFKGKLTTQIWRTLESILLDTPPDLSFKVKIIQLFLPFTKNRVWPASIKALKQISNSENIHKELIIEMGKQWKGCPCFRLLFKPFKSIPEISEIMKQPKQLPSIKMQKDKAKKRDKMNKQEIKQIQMFEPKTEKTKEKIYEKMDKNSTQVLKKKMKDERRNAEKKLYQDSAFIASQKMKKQRESDEIRKRKVAEIMGGLANLEGEVRKSKKSKIKL